MRLETGDETGGGYESMLWSFLERVLHAIFLIHDFMVNHPQASLILAQSTILVMICICFCCRRSRASQLRETAETGAASAPTVSVHIKVGGVSVPGDRISPLTLTCSSKPPKKTQAMMNQTRQLHRQLQCRVLRSRVRAHLGVRLRQILMLGCVRMLCRSLSSAMHHHKHQTTCQSGTRKGIASCL